MVALHQADDAQARFGHQRGDGKKIYDFLVYDASIRKKAMLDDKLAKVEPDEKVAAEAKIKEVHDKYDSK